MCLLKLFAMVYHVLLCNLMEMPNLTQNNETGLLIPAEEENPQFLADKMYNLIKDESFFRNVQTKTRLL